jgi:fumarylacetoacetase
MSAPQTSFVAVPYDSHFPIQNLPLGVFERQDQPGARLGVAIGDSVLDLAVLERQGVLEPLAAGGKSVFDRASLNALMALGRPAWQQTRGRIQELLAAENPRLRDDPPLRREALLPIADVELRLPVEIGDYTDFYSSREHATNVGAMFRGPDKALMPNWLHLPVAYHGRASSVIVSGTDLHRPLGQTRPDDAAPPVFGPSRAVDFELEMGALVGVGNELGHPIAIEHTAEHVFGMVLVNDWSARGIQKWEYVPLGPFLSKSFGTSISPWVVTLEALEPFRVSGPVQDPPVLDYLRSPGPWALDIQLAVSIQPVGTSEATIVTRTNARHLYWNVCQQMAHHTINGCNLRTGDLLATGTISGPGPRERGSLLELTLGGREPVELAGGQTRRYLQDGDRVTISGWCQGSGYRIGFGQVTGSLLPCRT